ncbi:hypothetical protein [Labrys monachus]|uniref:Uncharacterized protein n=1 Tax=Labrys monachus TaxID=217067 RepID=A0ABU0FLX1_9HYPH|nr:hypothetical protein [Labrys monachus]MDQ0395602.1 hypothetical protein [Labrys monachus]
MRFLAQSLGLFLAAAAFVAVIVDGTRSIADSGWTVLSIHGLWQWLSASSLARAQAGVDSVFSAFVWNDIVLPILELPFALLLAAGSVLCFWLGRAPRSRIGYVTHI